MLAPLENEPRDYAWGSTSLIADLQGRAPSGAPEAEVWFGDHPGSPARLPGGRTLRSWLQEDGRDGGAPASLTYLLKLLAAASPLSIQVHPSKDQAEAGHAAEVAAGVPADAADRNYRDDNHKPEVIVAVSDTFRALAGLRDRDETRLLLGILGERPGVAEVRQRLDGGDPAEALRGTLAWLLSGDAQEAVDDVIAAVAEARAEADAADRFAAELDAIGRIAEVYPGDPGVVVALLMNLVVLRRGEAVFVPAGILHAYLDGLGVELMAASDNVLRGGLTPKHIDVPELLRIVDTTPGDPPRLFPEQVATGIEVFRPGIPDFELWHVRAGAGRRVTLSGPAIVLATAGSPRVSGDSGAAVELSPGRAAFASPDEGALTVSGDGEVFVALPGA